jgi:hypothetical protein
MRDDVVTRFGKNHYESFPQPISKGITMKVTKRTTLASSIFALLLSAGIPAHAQDSNHATKSAAFSLSVAQAGAAQRDLWIGHVFWVRNVAAETLAGNEAAAMAAENEVVANARRISISIKPFYGKAASDQLFDLLASHYGAIKKIPWRDRGG